jgi:hypothetical protein
MEKVISQPTTRVIALRFDTIAEAEYLESVLESNLKITSDQGRPKEADELLKALKGCIELFKKKPEPKVEDSDPSGDYQKKPANPKQEYLDKIHGKQED